MGLPCKSRRRSFFASYAVGTGFATDTQFPTVLCAAKAVWGAAAIPPMILLEIGGSWGMVSVKLLVLPLSLFVNGIACTHDFFFTGLMLGISLGIGLVIVTHISLLPKIR
jgi:hypothetical protein